VRPGGRSWRRIPLGCVDTIVVAVDADGAGILEALADPPDATDREFLRRGVRYHDEAAFSVE
jgi:hypothetical protein